MIFRFDVQLATDLFAGTLNSDLVTGIFGTGRLEDDWSRSSSRILELDYSGYGIIPCTVRTLYPDTCTA